MGSSGHQGWNRSPPSPHQERATTIVMKFTDYTNLANIAVGALSFSIHQAAGLSTNERADTFIKVRRRQNLVALATYQESAAHKLLGTTELTILGNVHTVTSYRAHDPTNTRGVLHGVPASFTREQIRAALSIPGHRILDFRRMGESHSILITIEGPRLPREAIFCSTFTRLYPPRIYCRPCLHCLSLYHRTDVCPTRREFVRCRDCGKKFPPNQNPAVTHHDCELRCFNCHGHHSAINPSCQAWQAATRALRDRTRSIRNHHRDRLARTSLYGDAGACPGLSSSDRCTFSDSSSTSSSRGYQVTQNGSIGEDLLGEQIHRRSQNSRDLSRQDHTHVPTDTPPASLLSAHGYLGTASEQGRIAQAACSTASEQVTSQPEMANAGPHEQGHWELESRLKKLSVERCFIRNLLEKWMERADTVADDVSNAIQAGRFGYQMVHGFTALDRIFTLLLKAQVLLCEDNVVADPPELPRVAHRAITYPSPHSGAEAPPEDTNCFFPAGPPPSLNVLSVASPSVSYEVPDPHPSQSAVRPLLQKTDSPATAPTEPLVAEGRGARAKPPTNSNMTMGTGTGRLAPITEAVCQMVRPLPGGVQSPLPTLDHATLGAESCSEYATPTGRESKLEQHPTEPTPSATALSSLPSAQPHSHRGRGSASHGMSLPWYTSSPSTTLPTATAAPCYTSGTKARSQLGAKPMTTDAGPATRPAGLPDAAEMSSRTGTPNGVGALRRPPVCTETAVGAPSTVENGTAPQSVTVALPTRKSASGRAHADGSTQEAAGQSDQRERSKRTSGLRHYSQASHRVPKVSLKLGEDAKAGGDATSSCLLLCKQTNTNRGSGGVKWPQSCTWGQFDIPSAKLVRLGTVHKVVVSFYMTPSNFWLHLDSSAEVLEAMMNSLRHLCNASGPPAGFEARVGRSCAARYSADGCWYRARIMEKLLDQVQVSYVDYGNCELVKLEDLRPLDTFHASLPAQALHCTIQSAESDGPKDAWPTAAAGQFWSALGDADHLEARFRSRDRLSRRYVVDLLGRPAGGQAKVNLSQQFLSQYSSDAATPIQTPQVAAAPPDPPPAVNVPPVTPPLAVAPRPAASPGTSVAADPRPQIGTTQARVRLARAAAGRLQPLPSRVVVTPAAACPAVRPH